MRNRYEVQARCRCPVKPDDVDLYAFTIESEELIEVERIAAFFNALAEERMFQEELTRRCAVALGAKVTSVGWHSGVKVTSEAP